MRYYSYIKINSESIMRSFFKKVSRFLDVTRKVFINLFTAIFLIYIVVGFALLFSSKPIQTSGKVVIINPQGVFVENAISDFSIDTIISGNNEQLYAYRDFKYLIDMLADDAEVPAVLIDFSGAGYAGPTTLLNMAHDLQRLKDSGKEIIAYSDRFDTSSLLMASFADQVIIHPAGSINLNGLGGKSPYFNELLTKVGITFHNYSQGEFKSANEYLTRSDMSDNDRLQRLELLSPIWSELLDVISESRGVSLEELQAFSDTSFSVINEAAFDNINRALSLHLIDKTMTFPEFRNYMTQRFGSDIESDIGSYNHVFFEDYLTTINEDTVSVSEDEVVVIVAEGVIQEGARGQGIIGADDAVMAIRRAYSNEHTRAIVYRVNSPGGSIIASEMIRDELQEAKAKGIPVVISMGDLAASGGVYISTTADYIFAEPYTITGSIGVAIAVPTLENFMDKIGLHFDGASTSESGWDMYEAMSDRDDMLFSQWGEGAYNRFIDVVSTARNEDPEYIKSIAGGRVWLGSKALELNLVDAIGSIDEAIEKAAELATLTDYKVNYLQPELSFEETIIKLLLGSRLKLGSAQLLPKGMLEIIKLLNNSVTLSEPTASYVCTECLVRLP